MERASFGGVFYVPTPYFSFLVGTQRDILSVEASPGCRLSGLGKVQMSF